MYHYKLYNFNNNKVNDKIFNKLIKDITTL